MKCREVRMAIDGQRLDRLEDDQRQAILSHSEGCPECRRWLNAASVAASLIKSRVSVELEPSPFFRTRVTAAIREWGAAAPRWSAEKMWASTRAIVAAMFGIVMVLLALNLFSSKPAEINLVETARNASSIDRVLMDEGSSADENLTSGQVLDTVFTPGDSYGID